MSGQALKKIDSATFSDPDPVPEGGSRGWRIDFADTDGDPVAPKEGSVLWTLTDNAGNEIHGRRDQPLVVSETFAVVGINGNDCAVFKGETGLLLERVLLVMYKYDSKTLGTDQNGRIEICFMIRNLVAVE